MNPQIKLLVEESILIVENMACEGPVGEDGKTLEELYVETSPECAVTHDAQIVWHKLQEALQLIAHDNIYNAPAPKTANPLADR